MIKDYPLTLSWMFLGIGCMLFFGSIHLTGHPQAILRALAVIAFSANVYVVLATLFPKKERRKKRSGGWCFMDKLMFWVGIGALGLLTLYWLVVNNRCGPFD